MRILVTGAKGFVGKNLCEALKNIRDGKDRTRPALRIEEVFEFDIDSSPEQLNDWCREADFVFNLAGVNRPKDQSEFMEGNFGFASVLLDTLKNSENLCPVMLSSSQQASLSVRRLARICSLTIKRKQVQRSWSIVFQTCSVNGVALTTTRQWLHSAIILRMTCL